MTTFNSVGFLLLALSTFRNSAPNVHYVGANVCGSCHAEIFSSYAKTAMGRSMSLGADAALADRLPVPFRIFDNDIGEYLEVSRRPDGLYQSQYAVDRQGAEIFRQTFKVDYVVGAGQNGYGFVVRRGDYLFEAPLTYYTKSRVWSFSPGYEKRNLGFGRPVLAECIGCHAGRPQPVSNRAGLYKNPPFAELAIGCEECHGPGELHVAERRAGKPLSGAVDTAIVNPVRLSPWLSDNICMRCHQGGDVRLERPSKEVGAFRPGTALNQVLAIFKVPALRGGSNEQPVLLEHYFGMTLSKCYRSSAGRMRCTTCHNPHVQPVQATAAASYYRDRCLTCHQAASCKAASEERAKTSPVDSCVACHMPKQTVTTITHAALTSHRIAARPDEPLPEEAFRANTDRGLIDLTAGPGERSNPAQDTLVEAYAAAIRQGHSEFKPKLDELLDELARSSPQNAVVLSALARREMTKNTPESSDSAILYFRLAIKRSPTAFENHVLLASLLARKAQHQDAIHTLLQGLELNPYARECYESLAVEYMAVGEYGDALRTLKKGLDLFPDDSTLRRLEHQASSATLDGALTPKP